METLQLGASLGIRANSPSLGAQFLEMQTNRKSKESSLVYEIPRSPGELCLEPLASVLVLCSLVMQGAEGMSRVEPDDLTCLERNGQQSHSLWLMGPVGNPLKKPMCC